MKLHYLLYLCVASYSGGNFIKTIQSLPPVEVAKACAGSMFSRFSENLATHGYSTNCGGAGILPFCKKQLNIFNAATPQLGHSQQASILA